MPQDQETLHAFYSASALENGSSVLAYPGVTGDEVLVTCVTRDPEGSNYHWADKEYRGEVFAKGSRLVHKGSLSKENLDEETG